MHNLFRNYYVGKHIDYRSDVSPLIHCLGLHGTNLVGLELGVAKSDSFMTILDNCSNVDLLYGVDNYLPYFDNHTGCRISAYELDMIKAETFAKHKHSEHSHKIKFMEMSSDDAVKHFDDHTLDFIFIDADHSYKSVFQDLENWYPKIKTGGLLSGHDYHTPEVRQAVSDFRSKHSINNQMSAFLSCYIWKK